MSDPQLDTSIRAHLAPLLRSDGFTGSGRTFRKIKHGLIQILHVQGSRIGGQFAVELALHPQAIPDALGNPVDPKKISFASCEFRKRLRESDTDQWWAFEEKQSSMDLAVKAAAAVYVSVGRAFFASMSGPASPIFTLSPAEFRSGEFEKHRFRSTQVRLALAFVRIRVLMGDGAGARAFADIGLADPAATGAFKEKLEALRSST